MLDRTKDRHDLIVMLAVAFGAAVMIPSAIAALVTVLTVLRHFF